MSARPRSVVLVSSYVTSTAWHNITGVLTESGADGLPPGPPVLRQVRFDVHLSAWHQASRRLDRMTDVMVGVVMLYLMYYVSTVDYKQCTYAVVLNFAALLRLSARCELEGFLPLSL